MRANLSLKTKTDILRYFDEHVRKEYMVTSIQLKIYIEDYGPRSPQINSHQLCQKPKHIQNFTILTFVKLSDSLAH